MTRSQLSLSSTLCILALAWGMASAQSAGDVNPVLYTVNGEPVHAVDASLILQSMGGAGRPSGGADAEEKLAEMATERAIEQKLLAQQARSLGLEPDSERIAQTMSGMVKQAGGRDKLDAALATAGTSYDRLVENVREMELARAYIETQIGPGISVSEAEVERQYREHPERFAQPDKVQASHILIEVSADATAEEEANARKEADRAWERVTGGEDFAAVAREISDCPSASQGGDLGTFAPSQMVKPFADAVVELEPGEISRVIRTDFGYHVIRLEEKVAGETPPLAQIHDQIEMGLTMQKTAMAVAEVLQKLKDEAEIVEVLRD